MEKDSRFFVPLDMCVHMLDALGFDRLKACRAMLAFAMGQIERTTDRETADAMFDLVREAIDVARAEDDTSGASARH